MSWAALSEKLQALLPQFALPAGSVAAAQHLVNQVLDVGQLSLSLRNTSVPPSAAEAEALRSTLYQAMECIAAVDSRTQGQVVSIATERLVGAACHLIDICVNASMVVGVPAPRFLSCAQFLLRTGVQVQHFIVASVEAGQLPAGDAVGCLGVQVMALENWLLLVRCLPDLTSPAALAEQYAPPALVQQWLRQVLDSLCSLDTLPWNPRTGSTGLYGVLVAVLSQLLYFPAFGAHARLLLADDQLCSRLLKLMLPGVPTMAVALQLPPERCPAEFTWRVAARLAFVVFATAASHMPPLLPGDGPDAATRLLHAAAQLVQHCPFPASTTDNTGEAFDTISLAFIGQLGAIAGALVRGSTRQQHEAAPAALRVASAPATAAAGQVALPQRLAQQLLAVLPHIGEGLAVALQQLPTNGLKQWIGIACSARDVLSLLAGSAQQACICQLAAVQDLPTWLLGATTALRWLPVAANLAALEHSDQSSPAVPRYAESLLQQQSAVRLAKVSLQVADAVSVSGYAAVRSAKLRTTPHDPAVLAGCMDAVWNFHTASCRLTHWAQAGSMPPVLSSALGDLRLTLEQLIQRQLRTAAILLDGFPPYAPPKITRCLPAMAAAHCEAVLAVLDACGSASLGDELSKQLLSSIYALMVWGPPLKADPWLQAAVAQCLAQLGALQVGADLPLLEAAAANRNRPFAVVLVAGGLLEAAERAATSASHASLAQGIMQRAFNVVQALQLEASLVRRAVATTATAAAAAAAEAAAKAGMARAVAEAADSIRQALCDGGAVDEQGMLRTAAAWLPPARQLATALLAWWRRPEERQMAALELAQAAAARSCAYLRCANLRGEGGPAAGQGVGSQRCSACRAVWYCGTDCSHADWRAGHRRVCKALGAARAAEKERRRQAAAEAAAGKEQQE